MEFSKIEAEIQKAKEAEKKRSKIKSHSSREEKDRVFELNSLYKIENHLFFLKWMFFTFLLLQITLIALLVI